jgi:hypothetical protein
MNFKRLFQNLIFEELTFTFPDLPVFVVLLQPVLLFKTVFLNYKLHVLFSVSKNITSCFSFYGFSQHSWNLSFR